MTARLRTIAACDASAAAELAPWSREVEDRAMKAWIALDRFTGLSSAEIRQERRALLEMADMMQRALEAISAPEPYAEKDISAVYAQNDMVRS